MSPENVVFSQPLRSAINAFIDLANAKGIGTDLPTQEYVVRWMEKVSDTHWEERKEICKEPDLLTVFRAVENELSKNPHFQALSKPLRTLPTIFPGGTIRL